MKLYESTRQTESKYIIDGLNRLDVERKIAEWKARANQFREPSKVRFCERRMINYRDLLKREDV